MPCDASGSMHAAASPIWSQSEPIGSATANDVTLRMHSSSHVPPIVRGCNDLVCRTHSSYHPRSAPVDCDLNSSRSRNIVTQKRPSTSGTLQNHPSASASRCAFAVVPLAAGQRLVIAKVQVPVHHRLRLR